MRREVEGHHHQHSDLGHTHHHKVHHEHHYNHSGHKDLKLGDSVQSGEWLVENGDKRITFGEELKKMDPSQTYGMKRISREISQHGQNLMIKKSDMA